MRKILALIFLILIFAVFGQSISHVRIVPSNDTYFAGSVVRIYWEYTETSIPSNVEVKITLWRLGNNQNTFK